VASALAAFDVRDRDPRPLATEQDRHCAPVADRRIREAVVLLAASDDEDAASCEPPAAGGVATRLVEEIVRRHRRTGLYTKLV
jgi:hypothetical protein